MSFWKKLLGAGTASGDATRNADKTAASVDRKEQVRPHHYCFAHQALPGVLQANPSAFMRRMGSDEATPFLDWMWKKAEEHAKARAETSFADLRHRGFMLEGCKTAVITLPAPQATSEAYMVAAVLIESPGDSTPARARFFTLELHENLDGSRSTALCEWVGTSHRLLGFGTAPDITAFVAAVKERLGGAAPSDIEPDADDAPPSPTDAAGGPLSEEIRNGDSALGIQCMLGSNGPRWDHDQAERAYRTKNRSWSGTPEFVLLCSEEPRRPGESAEQACIRASLAVLDPAANQQSVVLQIVRVPSTDGGEPCVACFATVFAARGESQVIRLDAGEVRFRPRAQPIRVDQTRPHHYCFAHQMIAVAFRSDPLFFIGILTTDDTPSGIRSAQEAPKYLAWMWRKAEEHVQAPAESLLEDVRYRRFTLDRCPTVILTMPAPWMKCEAYMVAAVLIDPPRDSTPARLAYFTLELSQDNDGLPCTMLCEWVGETHRLIGEGPEPEVEAFAAAVEQLVRARR